VRLRRVIPLLAALAAAAALLSGCVILKPGSLALTQPAGIGSVHLRFALCTAFLVEGEPEEIKTGCRSSEEEVQGEMLLALLVPAGTGTPETIATAPSPGAPPASFVREPAVAAAFVANGAAQEEPVALPPPGFEIVGYRSGLVTDPGSAELDWTVEADLALPPVADGGSYGGPFKTTVLPGWYEVVGPQPAGGPIDCESGEELDFCAVPEPGLETEVGVSDLRIAAPVAATALQGARVKLPFGLDFASSAAPPATFALSATSTLPGAAVRVSSDAFSRAPSDAATKRAPLTTRRAIVRVPPKARPGAYRVTLTATTPLGGAVASTALLRVKRAGNPRVGVPKRVRARLAWRKGVPARVVLPLAGSRVVAKLLAPKRLPGKAKLVKKSRRAKAAGQVKMRLKIPRRRALALLAARAKLTAEFKIFQPGRKPLRLRRGLRLR